MQNWWNTFWAFQLPKSKQRDFFQLLEFWFHFTYVIFKLTIFKKYFLLPKIGQWIHVLVAWSILNLVSACEVKSNLIDELEVEFEDGMECEKFPKLGDMIYLPHY